MNFEITGISQTSLSSADISQTILQSVNLNKQVYETEEQFINKVIFYLCCIDHGISPDKSETLCNIYRNKCKYKVGYPEQIEKEIQTIIDKYGINKNI